MTDEHDDLDRAIFALPLEPPPAGLRESILRVTSGATIAARPAFHTWEIGLVGIGLAVLTWLLATFVTDHTFASGVVAQAGAVLAQLAETRTLAWLVTGASIAFCLSPGSLGFLRPGSDRA